MAVEMITLSGREEWLEARKGRIGGSDASAIVGMNPYKTNIDLFNEKTGLTEAPDISDKPYVRYGTDAEPHLRALFALDFPQYEVLYQENNMWLNDKYPFAHASLDGWLVEKETGRKGILEIKTTEILRSQQKEKWRDQIPDNYYAQILWYMMVTEFDFAVLKGQLKTVFDGIPYIQTRHYVIERDEVQADIGYIAEAAKTFAQHIALHAEPPLVLPEF